MSYGPLKIYAFTVKKFVFHNDFQKTKNEYFSKKKKCLLQVFTSMYQIKKIFINFDMRFGPFCKYIRSWLIWVKSNCSF